MVGETARRRRRQETGEEEGNSKAQETRMSEKEKTHTLSLSIDRLKWGEGRESLRGEVVNTKRERKEETLPSPKKEERKKERKGKEDRELWSERKGKQIGVTCSSLERPQGYRGLPGIHREGGKQSIGEKDRQTPEK